MLSIRKFIKEEEVLSYILDPTYTKVVFEPKSGRKNRDIAVNLYISYHYSVLNGVLGMIQAHSKNPDLPQEAKDFLQRRWDRIKNRQYISVQNLKELKKLEEEHNISFTIPKILKKYINDI